jgi:8-oxo-dGTP pyrophosphatase MutT (NUDIX family)
VEAEESPQAACRREVAEELGLDRPVGRVLVLEWVPSRPERPEGVIVIYDGGVLATEDIEAIRVPEEELADYAFVPVDRLAGTVTPLVLRRITASKPAARIPQYRLPWPARSATNAGLEHVRSLRIINPVRG